MKMKPNSPTTVNEKPIELDYSDDDIHPIGTQTSNAVDSSEFSPVSDTKVDEKKGGFVHAVKVGEHSDGHISEGSVEDDIYVNEKGQEDSPYAEVRACVDPTDDIHLPCNTIRMWVVGLLFSTIGAGVNLFFSLRNPTVYISVLIAELLSYPALQLWDLIFPDREWRIGRFRFNLKPGPFNLKEHALIVVMANVSFGNAYSTDIILAQRVRYGQNFGFGYEICLTLATQLIGYGLAGLSRRFLVRPASMIWPGNLVQCTMIKTLHHNDSKKVANGWRIRPFLFFFFVMIGAFVWNWFPSYIFPALSLFAWVTWLRPNSPVVNQLFGETTGVSLLPMTFDWNQVSSYMGSPLVCPTDALTNILIGTAFFFWIVTCGIHYSNKWYSEYLPISSSGIMDNQGNSYNVTRILTADKRFDPDAYRTYSPLFLSTTYALSFGLSFASISAVITHVLLYNGKDIWDRFKQKSKPDIHEKLMQQYEEVPDWWYLSLFVIFFGLMLGVCYGWDTETPAWVVIIGLILALIWFLPIGIVQAVTNIQIGLNVFAEFIVGYMYPGHPLAMMIFKTVTYITMAQGLGFVGDLKFGHYMKLPPKTMFWTQTVATIWSCFVQIGVLDWALTNIDGVCKKGQADNYTCPGATVFFNSSVVWGVIGPKRMFSGKSLYTGLQWFWLIGVVVTILFWALHRKWPNALIGKLNAPLFFGGTGYIPPATPTNYYSWCGVGLFFNHYIRRRFADWWTKYNFNLSAGLDTGTQIGVIIIFFCLQLQKIDFPSWWGTTGALNTMDANGEAIRKVVNATAGEFFGPSSWE
ncbi:OPT oligopeptide transporter Isp4 [Schizosaccharomyces japonicus yFS275]|uniref:OPT oligopeptide transporter Isp4 n=1 Tax=Schizosaccharomyces japonicus (strain yFS275 / FY16936) TaxID=402676 RepID=B6JWZ7_SCHJY|nr:OPT oligopeptide transporter Isp4 [Schizosaccharomyces japonicus yFS275]EEB05898.2 OPT oligopeptide transporter Isp4 [Schizosaccharomyces japonicus yFS275]